MEIILKYFTALSETQIAQFNELKDLYQYWNSRINVISRKDVTSLYEKHVLHSLSIAVIFDFASGAEIIDIGSGGGFPGIPLAISFPRVQFHLVDSIAKKLRVVDDIAKKIGLKNVTIQHVRAEEIRNRKFDFAVSRAVSSLKELWKWSKPLLKRSAPGSVFKWTGDGELQPGLICLKGGDLTGEISESKTKPRIIEISEIFREPFFKEKYILYIHR